MTAELPNYALVLGASGGLGSALVAQFLSDPSIARVFAISRAGESDSIRVSVAEANKLVWIKTEYDEPSMVEVTEQLKPHAGQFGRCVFVMGCCTQTPFGQKNALKTLTLKTYMRYFKAIRWCPRCG